MAPKLSTKMVWVTHGSLFEQDDAPREPTVALEDARGFALPSKERGNGKGEKVEGVNFKTGD